jgi:DHA3 family macrolide efflux protein-like MFS transporter
MQESSATETKRPMGMRAFGIIWFGQVISLLGSAMTAFAVTIWVYEGTEKATALALTGFFFVTPLLLLSPIAGALVDRYNRRLMMMISDLASGATTVVLLTLHATGYLEVWHLFVLNAINGAFQAFQWPAFSAAISLMVPKEQYGRANGMMELAGSASQIVAPVLAGALIGPIGLTGILMIDIFTFVFAVVTLLFVHIPQPETSPAGQEGQGTLLTESIYGFRYILRRPSLLGLQLIFMIGNFFSGIAFAVYAAMILARTGNDEVVFGTVQSVGAIGAVAGGAAMAAWGGPKQLVHGVLGGWILSGLFLSMAGVAQSLPAWAVAGFLGMFLVPIINGSNQAIWQAKVAPDVQGRVFSTRRLIAWFVSPIATLIAGPLVDLGLEPSMAEGGAAADAWGWLVGIGDGAGMGLLFVIGGLLSSLVGLIGYTVPAVRDAENILPDHDSPEAQAEREAEAARAREPAPVSGGWSLSRKLGTAVAAATLAVLIVGLGWLQVKVLTAAADEDVTQEIAEARSEAAVQPSPTPLVTPTVAPTPRPTLTESPPKSSPVPTLATSTPTSVPPTPVPPTATPAPGVLAGELVSYTLTVANNGPSHATGVVISDTLPLGAILNWAYFSQGSGCRVGRQAQDADLQDVVVCEMGALEVGAEAVITFAVALDSSLGGLITNAVAVGSNESDPNQTDNLVTRENMVYVEADLNVQADVPKTVVAGKALSYTLTVVNQGPMDATDVTLSNRLSAAMRFVSATPSQGGGCGLSQDEALFADSVTVLCDLGDLGSGQQATVAVFAAVDPSAEGEIESLATVGARETDLHMSDNSVSTMVGLQAQANLAIVVVETGSDSRLGGVDLTVQASASTPAVAGEQLTFTVTITNVGALAATGVVMNDAMPDGVRLVLVAPGQGKGCGLRQDGVVSCFLGDLDAGAVGTIVLGVLVDPGMSGEITSPITVAANEIDLDPSNNVMTVETAVERRADLTIR